MKSGDTLFLIAERELGNGDRWQEIMQLDCTTFTEEEARRLQPGDEVCLPDDDGGSNSSFEEIVSSQTYATMFPNRDRFSSK